jgi:hypothetical protein
MFGDKSQKIVVDRRLVVGGLLLALLAYPVRLLAGSVTIPNIFTNGQVADANQVNADFAALATAVNDNDSRITALEAAALTVAQRDTLTNGGNADALHHHSGAWLPPEKPRWLNTFVKHSTTTNRVTILDVAGPGYLQDIQTRMISDASNPLTKASFFVTLDSDTPQEVDLLQIEWPIYHDLPDPYVVDTTPFSNPPVQTPVTMGQWRQKDFIDYFFEVGRFSTHLKIEVEITAPGSQPISDWSIAPIVDIPGLGGETNSMQLFVSYSLDQ